MKDIKDLTNEEFHSLFNSFDDYCNFSKVAQKSASRPDVHAMIVLDRLLLDLRSMSLPLIHCVKNSTVWFTITAEQFKEVATIEIIRELVRCGVSYDLHHNCLALIMAGDFH